MHEQVSRKNTQSLVFKLEFRISGVCVLTVLGDPVVRSSVVISKGVGTTLVAVVVDGSGSPPCLPVQKSTSVWRFSLWLMTLSSSILDHCSFSENLHHILQVPLKIRHKSLE